MQMSLIILPEEQKCSPKEQINQCLVQLVFPPLYKGAIVSESTRGHKKTRREKSSRKVLKAKILKCQRREDYKGLLLSEKLHPYVVFLPTEKKDKILSAIFGSKAGVDILRFSLKQGISKNIYQKELVKSLNYSNKTIIENLKTLTKLGVLTESMEKNDKEGRIIWVKAYQLTDLGRWFALLLAEEKELSEKEKSEILQSLFRTYVKLVKDLAEELSINKKMLEEIFNEEMK